MRGFLMLRDYIAFRRLQYESVKPPFPHPLDDTGMGGRVAGYGMHLRHR
jgi:hypothetical protein